MCVCVLAVYRRVSSDPCKEWLERLKAEEVPVIVCMTHADRLYVECIEDSTDKSPVPTNDKKRKIGLELDVRMSLYLTSTHAHLNN